MARSIMISISDILNVLRFFTDKETRQLFRSICGIAARDDPAWKENIKFLSATFSAGNAVEVKDSGPGFDLQAKVKKLKDVDTTTTSGLGLSVVYELVDDLFTDKKGNTVTAIMIGQKGISAFVSIEKIEEQEIL